MANSSVMSLLEDVISGLDTEKQASSTDYEAGDPPATTGARASENAADVKSDVPGESVDDSAEKETVSGAGEDTPTNTQGTVAAATGEDPESTDSTKDDPGTSHVATAGGEKYATTNDVIAGGNDFLADLLVLSKEASDYTMNSDSTDSEGADDSSDGETEGDTTEDSDGSEKEASHTLVEDFDLEKLASIEDEQVLVNKDHLVKLSEAATGFVELLGYLQGLEASGQVLTDASEKAASDNDDDNAEGGEDLAKYASDLSAQAIDTAKQEASDLAGILLGYKESMGMDPAAMMGAAAPVEEVAVEDPMAAEAGMGEEIPAELIEALIAGLEGEGLAPEDIAGEAAAPAIEEPAAAEGGDAIDDARAAAAGEEVASEGGDEEDTKVAQDEKVAKYVAAIKTLVEKNKTESSNSE